MKKIFLIISLLLATTTHTTKLLHQYKKHLSGIRLTKFLLKKNRHQAIDTPPIKLVKKSVKKNLDPAFIPTQKRNRIK